MCLRALSLDTSEFHPGCYNSHFDQLIRLYALCDTNSCCSCHGKHYQFVVLLRGIFTDKTISVIETGCSLTVRCNLRLKK
jgi:hypothetical protein